VSITCLARALVAVCSNFCLLCTAMARNATRTEGDRKVRLLRAISALNVQNSLINPPAKIPNGLGTASAELSAMARMRALRQIYKP
jgi:hypothetical protein